MEGKLPAGPKVPFRLAPPIRQQAGSAEQITTA